MQNTIKEKAYAKINLGLDIIGKRSDGYHEVDMVMQTIGLCDDVAISIVGDLGNTDDIPIALDIEQMSYGEKLLANEDNLCVKAAISILDADGKKAHFTDNPRGDYLLITLEKRIPIAAGMAGGSTDAAAVLRGINALLDLQMSNEALREIATPLGADIPFCINGGTVRCKGIGEILTPFTPLPAWDIVITKPKTGVSTAEIYKSFDALESPKHPDIESLIKSIEEQNMAKCACHLGNALEAVTIQKLPIIHEIKELMSAYGAIRAIMTGSGPTVFGLYTDHNTAAQAAMKIAEWGLCPETFVTTLGAGQND